MRHFPLVATVGIVLSMAGCKSATETVWSADTQSSDHAWLAIAHRENTTGPGINAQYMIVQMKQANIPDGKRVEVLVLDEGGEPTRDLKMAWETPSHLHVTYRGNPTVLFQAVKAFGMDVQVERLPG